MEGVAEWLRVYGIEYAGYAARAVALLAVGRMLGRGFRVVMKRPVEVYVPMSPEQQYKEYLLCGWLTVGMVVGFLGYVAWQAVIK